MGKPNIARRGVGLFLIACVFVIAGCASNDLLRTNTAEICTFQQAGDCADAAIQHHAAEQADEYYLAFVEFDDQGQLRDRRQFQAVLDDYYPIAGNNDVLLVAFVHGWHHSAKPGDNNIRQFRKLLERLSRTESLNSAKLGRQPRKVLGVYVGWRGDSLTIPYLNDLTFWERKNTAHDVGGQGTAEVFLKLEEIVNVKAGMDAPDGPASRLVLIGHSFGGAVTFTALQQILVDRYYNSRRGTTFQGSAQGFGDLVVLVNPAIEALRYATLYDIGQQDCRNYTPGQVPRLAVLTSESDLATKWAFPAGRFFSTLFETHSDLERIDCVLDAATGRYTKRTLKIKEGEADRNTIGHFMPFVTHRLEAANDGAKAAEEIDYTSLHDYWLTQKPAATLAFEGMQLVHLGKTHPFNPYLNIRVDKRLIPNHNDIWGDEVIGFIRDLITVSTMPQLH